MAPCGGGNIARDFEAENRVINRGKNNKMNTQMQNQAQVGHEAVAQRAKQIWEIEGRQAGRDLEYWLRAERELKARPQGPAGVTRAPEASRESKAPTPGGARTMRI
jgi:hypothetical protein